MRNLVLPIGLIILLSNVPGCQTSSVVIKPEKASVIYYDCLYTQYNVAVSKGSPQGEESIESAIDACYDDVMNYASAIARENHPKVDMRPIHAYDTYRPILQKEAAVQLRAYLKTLN